jgi:hypothetical protein
MKRRAITATTLAALLLSACAGGAVPRATTRAPSAGQRPATNAHRGAAARPVVPISGADAVMGRDMAALVRLFGTPRLDVTEGAGHKVQFANDRCILDAYLYAPSNGANPVVTHVDARSPDGEDTDRAACIAALQRR